MMFNVNKILIKITIQLQIGQETDLFFKSILNVLPK